MPTIQEVAKITGVSADTLRYYEKINLLPRIRRESSGHRRYDDSDLGWIWFLKLLRETGMPIRGMQQFVALTNASDRTIPQRIELLREHRSKLAHQINDLRTYLETLDKKITYYTNLSKKSRRRTDKKPASSCQ